VSPLARLQVSRLRRCQKNSPSAQIYVVEAENRSRDRHYSFESGVKRDEKIDGPVFSVYGEPIARFLSSPQLLSYRHALRIGVRIV
jgi:hypothetical protein